LAAAGYQVDLRDPPPHALYDTTVHFVVEGISLRVPEDVGRLELARVAAVVRDAEARRPSDPQRFRAMPIYRGQTNHVLAWVDVFASDGL
jgi:hypothetical protein